MNGLSLIVMLGLAALGGAQLSLRQPDCDSAEAEEAASAARDYLNAQHTHGYKYQLNRIEDIKVLNKPGANDTYIVELDLLETDCHVLDPTPVANCTVRPKALTAVEGDCDVVLKRVAGVLTVTAFKCKTEESTEDLCLGCPTLLPLNDTKALDFVHASLATLNNQTVNATYSLLEVGRMSTQIVSGGPHYLAEYIFTEANCTNDVCVPLNDIMAPRGICTAKGLGGAHTLDCKLFSTMVPPQDANSTGASPFFPKFHVHTQNLTRSHGLRHHKLTSLHDPHLTGLLSSESESAEVVSVATPAVLNTTSSASSTSAATSTSATASTSSAVSTSDEVPVAVVKRDVPAGPATVTDAVLLVPPCPGRRRFF
ncbi:alpha-2-HS-glycoprotein-like [Corythoichthys intestinalis]|uniref:alpha-2-HS-glycoprotein-like n=1 Tax=Corythoichthys intestinalis TaxID=161448 RepID=UPI0025A5C907|nr:alpha-2-HS-glycoprotein-like [Corythoichthys intestinalis]XP_061794774.1 alpha-2-HS-glycoprotein-like [Nerophis lumbriciformis]